MAIAYALGLNFSAPSKGDTDWDVTEATKDTKVSLHDHTGGGLGNQIGSTALIADSVSAPKIRLANNASLRARNAANAADVNLFRLSTGDLIDFQTAILQGGAGSTETISSGAVSIVTAATILNSATAYTLAAGTKGQLKFITSASGSASTVTFSGATTKIFSIGAAGCAVLWASAGADWTLLGGSSNCTTTEVFSAIGTWSGASLHVRCTGTTYTVSMPAGAGSVAGQQVYVENAATGAVTFGGASMATLTYYLYSYLNGAWRRVQLA